ncbi:MAG: lysine--tRNA ligase [Spirochaetes bacterium]|nr:MAG: lysine--tRNA ligase [Spirochaetota bacterium]
MEEKQLHWADYYAEKIIREKGDKEVYVCASGITPSGTVHIGNFREIISVELVVRALRQKGKKVRFIYSWDDYDVFRRVPSNIKNRQIMETYLRKPITSVPDPEGREESYARVYEKELEELLPLLGIEPEYIYQANMYKSSTYAGGIKKALEKRETIRKILNEHRTSPLPHDWWPLSVFCTSCQRDTTKMLNWDGEWEITYSCNSCGNRQNLDIRKTSSVKLPWRVDWPMRWDFEDVDFEPAGKDHHSEGGSFDTAKKIVTAVYEHSPPVTFQYDFLSIKGRGGKISSSTGDVVSLKDVLAIYQPQVIRYLFAGTRPNTEFAISFDLDVLKIYEDYDRCERIYFGLEKIGEKREAKEKRIYELSQIGEPPGRIPYQVPFRHLCNLVQIHVGDVEAVVEGFKGIVDDEKDYIRARARCAWNWINLYAPDEFKFLLKGEDDKPIETDDTGRKVLSLFKNEVIEKLDSCDDQSLSKVLFDTARKSGLKTGDFFKYIYQALIGKDRGPRLANFLLAAGKEKIEKALKHY